MDTKRKLAEEKIISLFEVKLCQRITRRLPDMTDAQVYGIMQRLGYRWYADEKRWGY